MKTVTGIVKTPLKAFRARRRNGENSEHMIRTSPAEPAARPGVRAGPARGKEHQNVE